MQRIPSLSRPFGPRYPSRRRINSAPTISDPGTLTGKYNAGTAVAFHVTWSGFTGGGGGDNVVFDATKSDGTTYPVAFNDADDVTNIQNACNTALGSGLVTIGGTDATDFTVAYNDHGAIATAAWTLNSASSGSVTITTTTARVAPVSLAAINFADADNNTLAVTASAPSGYKIYVVGATGSGTNSISISGDPATLNTAFDSGYLVSNSVAESITLALTASDGIASPASRNVPVNLTFNLGAIAYYTCEESSGDLLDSTSNARTLTAINAPGSGTGIIGNGRTFTAASTQYFKGTIPSIGLNSTFIADGFDKITNVGASRSLFAVVDGSNNLVLTVFFNSGTGKLQFQTALGQTVATTESITVNVGFYWRLEYANGPTALSVNNGTPATGSLTSFSTSGTSLEIGRCGTSVLLFNGTADEIGLYTGVTWTDEMRAARYNSGSLRRPSF